MSKLCQPLNWAVYTPEGVSLPWTVTNSERKTVSLFGPGWAWQLAQDSGYTIRRADWWKLQKQEPKTVKPVLMVLLNDTGLLVTMNPPEVHWSHEHYALLLCDLVGHISKEFNVPESAVWDWVDLERVHPTTTRSQRQNSLH